MERGALPGLAAAPAVFMVRHHLTLRAGLLLRYLPAPDQVSHAAVPPTPSDGLPLGLSNDASPHQDLLDHSHRLH